uniref:Ribosomal protein S19 n=1 Tax=Acavomonas peruviana TaxID=1542312 RepID=V5KWK4_9ALVE|nr:ribosomal protein S19 [Acavomonas peruviana]
MASFKKKLYNIYIKDFVNTRNSIRRSFPIVSYMVGKYYYIPNGKKYKNFYVKSDYVLNKSYNFKFGDFFNTRKY